MWRIQPLSSRTTACERSGACIIIWPSRLPDLNKSQSVSLRFHEPLKWKTIHLAVSWEHRLVSCTRVAVVHTDRRIVCCIGMKNFKENPYLYDRQIVPDELLVPLKHLVPVIPGHEHICRPRYSTWTQSQKLHKPCDKPSAPGWLPNNSTSVLQHRCFSFPYFCIQPNVMVHHGIHTCTYIYVRYVAPSILSAVTAPRHPCKEVYTWKI